MTPAEVKLPGPKKTLRIECNKDGYQTGNKNVVGRVEGSTAGNILLGGGIGVGVDSLTGAIYKYPGTISIPLTPIGESSGSVTNEPIAK